MLPRGEGAIFFTGATASLRGGNGYAAFASAKAGLRLLAQAMARKLDDPEVLGATLAAVGLPAAELFALAQDQGVKDQLAANTQAAVDAGAFGIPSFLLDGELYFGKETLREIEDVLANRATPS